MSSPSKPPMAQIPGPINLDAVKLNMDEILKIIVRLQGKRLVTEKGEPVRRISEYMRDMRRIEDLFRGSAALVNNEMWVARGYSDMLGE